MSDTSTNSVDLFDDLATETPETPETTPAPDAQPEASAPSAPTETTSTDEAPPLTEIPDGAISVTEFAAELTQLLMRRAMETDSFKGNEYVVPQAVYQTTKAQRDRIPHVVVKTAADKEARVYILREPATEWWLARQERLADRGSGTAAASSRTPEQNQALLHSAVQRALWATDRKNLWTEREAQATSLVDKYKGFLKDADVSDETIELLVQEASDAYAAEQAAKAAKKDKKAKDTETE